MDRNVQFMIDVCKKITECRLKYGISIRNLSNLIKMFYNEDVSIKTLNRLEFGEKMIPFAFGMHKEVFIQLAEDITNGKFADIKFKFDTIQLNEDKFMKSLLISVYCKTHEPPDQWFAYLTEKYKYDERIIRKWFQDR